MLAGIGELAIIVIIALIFFGGDKVPRYLGALGQGVRAFKEGAQEDPDAPKSPTPEAERVD